MFTVLTVDNKQESFDTLKEAHQTCLNLLYDDQTALLSQGDKSFYYSRVNGKTLILKSDLKPAILTILKGHVIINGPVQHERREHRIRFMTKKRIAVIEQSALLPYFGDTESIERLEYSNK